MTALERQLTRALRELSAQYEQERTQHAEQIAALQRQVEHFAGQATRLIADYRNARRDVARAVELIQQHARRRGQERDAGRSR